MPWVAQPVSTAGTCTEQAGFGGRLSHLSPCLALSAADTLSGQPSRLLSWCLTAGPTLNLRCFPIGPAPQAQPPPLQPAAVPGPDLFPGLRSCHHLQATCAKMLELLQDPGAEGQPGTQHLARSPVWKSDGRGSEVPILESFASGVFCSDNLDPR